MKRISLLLSLFLLALLRLSAQTVSLDGMIVKTGVAVDGGYYVLSRGEREQEYNRVITTYYTPQLVYLDADLQPQWSVEFEEYSLPTMDYVTVIGERIYVSGTQYPGGGERCVGWLVCLSMDGEALWEKKLALEGHHSVEGHQVYPGPDGDVVWVGHSYRNYNSYEHPLAVRLRPDDGSEVWRRSYSVPSISSMMLGCTLLADGNLAFTGSDFKTQAEFGDNMYEGAVWKVNGETGTLLWEQRIHLQDETHWTGVQPLADGGLVMTGWAGGKGVPSLPIVAQLDSRGTVLQQDYLRQFPGAMMYELWQVEDGYCMLGRQVEGNPYEGPSQTLILRLDASLRAVGQATHAPGEYMDYVQTPDAAIGFSKGMAYRWQLPVARGGMTAGGSRPGASGSGMQGVGRPQVWIGGR